MRKGILAAIAALALTIPAAQAEEYTLRFSQHHSSQSGPYQQVTLALKDYIEKESGGRLKVETFPNGILHGTADGFKALVTDITDIAPTYPMHSPNSFHLAHGLFLPGAFATAYAQAQASEELYPKYLKPEYQAMGVENFMHVTSAPYQLLTTKEVKTLADLHGMKIRGAGGAVNKMVVALGATPVTTSGSEIYSAFQQGVVDGVLIPAESIKTYRLQEIAKYFVPVDLGRAGDIPFGLSRSTYEKLPDDLKDVIYRAGRYGTLLYADFVERDIKEGMDALAEHNVTIVEFSEEDLAILQKAKDASWNEFIKANEGSYPAQEFVDEMKSLARRFGAMDREAMIERQAEVGKLEILPAD